MADFADKGRQTEDFFRDIALGSRAPSGPRATGFCLNCDKKLPDGLRWCDEYCRDDWEFRDARRG